MYISINFIAFLYLDFRLNSMGSTPPRLVQHYNRDRIRGFALGFLDSIRILIYRSQKFSNQ